MKSTSHNISKILRSIDASIRQTRKSRRTKNALLMLSVSVFLTVGWMAQSKLVTIAHGKQTSTEIQGLSVIQSIGETPSIKADSTGSIEDATLNSSLNVTTCKTLAYVSNEGFTSNNV